MINNITRLEIRYLRNYAFPTLFQQLIKFYPSKLTQKFDKTIPTLTHHHHKLLNGDKNKEGNFIKLSNELKMRPFEDRHLEPSWGLPKGRRNKMEYESDIDCAKREVFEETEISPFLYKIDRKDKVFNEFLTGTDGRMYKHTYFLARMDEYHPVYLNPFNKTQMSEIRKIGWFTYEEAMKKFRSYHSEKKEILTQVDNYIRGLL
jgi:8-oxo-dGTP pyrophosphatase MutT (NUDIX family)